MNSILQGKLLPVSCFSGGRVSVAPGASQPAAGPAPCPPPPGRAPASAARPATPASQQPALQRKQLLSGFPEPARYTVPRAAPGRDLGSPGFTRVWCKVLENPWDRRLSSSQRQTVFIWAPWFTVSSTNMAASKINQWNFTKRYTSDTGIVTSFSRKPQITQQNLL